MITTQNSVLSGAPTPQELELINNYTVKPLSADEVYTFGIVLCEVYRRSNHLLAPMLLHFAANVLSVILTYTKAEYASQTMYIIFMILSFAVSFVIYWFVIRKAKAE